MEVSPALAEERLVARRIVLLPSAERDLENIYEYTHEQWGSRQAERYLSGLRRKLDRLAERPNMAPILFEDGNVHAALYEKHRILYREIASGIEVGRILHQAQELERALALYRTLRTRLEPYLDGEG